MTPLDIARSAELRFGKLAVHADLEIGAPPFCNVPGAAAGCAAGRCVGFLWPHRMRLVNLQAQVATMPVKVSIVEDDRETRETLKLLLNGAENVRCLKDYASGEEALRGIPVEKPDVAMVDINLPGISGIECIARLKLKLPELRVLVLTSYGESDRIFDSLRAGASGYLLKKSGYAELVQAVEQIHAGGAPMSMQVARQVVDHFHQIQKTSLEVERLTSREQEILALLAQGYLNKEISDQLGISVNTVGTHVQHIYEKLHVQTRTAAAAKFLNR